MARLWPSKDGRGRSGNVTTRLRVRPRGAPAGAAAGPSGSHHSSEAAPRCLASRRGPRGSLSLRPRQPRPRVLTVTATLTGRGDVSSWF